MKIPWKLKMTRKVHGLFFVAACVLLVVGMVGAKKLADDLSAASDQEMKELQLPAPQLMSGQHTLASTTTTPTPAPVPAP